MNVIKKSAVLSSVSFFLVVVFLTTSFVLHTNRQSQHVSPKVALANGVNYLIENEGENLVLRVSLDNSEGRYGHLTIKNMSNHIELESDFELIKSPYYASVNITTLAQGDYIFELTTNVRTHIDTVNIH